MKLKRASYKNGRGYSGFHIGYYNQKVNCRSMLEKIYCLILDEKRLFYKTEKQVYEINGYIYKPDFFIYDENNNLLMIREIKGSKDEKLNYMNRFSEFFISNNIDYDVIIIDKRKYIKKWNKEIEEFINLSDSYIQSGVLNPMYGMKQKEITKEKIRKKTSKRWKDEKERDKMIYGTRKAMRETKVREMISKKQKISHRKKRIKKLRNIIAQKGGFIEKKCCICDGVFLDRIYNDRKHCFENSCIQKNSPKNQNRKQKWKKDKKIKRFENTLLKIACSNFNVSEIYINNFDLLRKQRLYNKSPLSMNSIIKYFDDIENFKRRMIEWQKSNV